MSNTTRTTYTYDNGETKTGEACSNCGATYAKCSKMVVVDRKGACCGSCGYNDTHDEKISQQVMEPDLRVSIEPGEKVSMVVRSLGAHPQPLPSDDGPTFQMFGTFFEVLEMSIPEPVLFTLLQDQKAELWVSTHSGWLPVGRTLQRSPLSWEKLNEEVGPLVKPA